jgi:peroxiredoxin
MLTLFMLIQILLYFFHDNNELFCLRQSNDFTKQTRFEDTKRVIIIRISQKNRQQNGQNKNIVKGTLDTPITNIHYQTAHFSGMVQTYQ